MSLQAPLGLWAQLVSFARNRDGNVAMLWGLVGATLLALIGLSTDFARAQTLRAQVQNATDGAALVAERSSALPFAERVTAARAYFDQTLGNPGLTNDLTFNVVQMEDGGHRVSVSLDMELGLARLIRNQDWTIRVASESISEASPPLEVALVLDNTGSMSNDMQVLRDSTEELIESLLSIDGDTVKVALVPFVAQVNIGNDPSRLDWMDTTGVAPYNGELLEDRMIGRVNHSNWMGANCENINTLPYAGYTGPYRVNWVRNGTRCYAFTPNQINYFTLYDLVGNEDWGGCVELRPEPYDVQDTAPSIGNPDTLFVPFMWIDTRDGETNDYFDDDFANIIATNGANTAGVTMRYDIGGSAANANYWRTFNVFKYNGQNANPVGGAAPNVSGPNRGCPTPIIPLTNDRDTLVDAARAMRHWSGGGTNQVAGLSWGWHVLSPTAPFTQGAPYDPEEVRKIVVLMTDGENTNVGSIDVLASDMAAYNHRGLWTEFADGESQAGAVHGSMPVQYRRNITSSGAYVSYVDSREAILCQNIKNAGIEIYTVVFREPSNAVRTLLRNCATDSEHAFTADSQSELRAVFRAIGTGIGELRITH
ncbi:MAG: VWA domain-containing protein [Alphaproteobacteria bacterium]|nr:VWA domain-containing protein [Alphaproteobacteria bacterium]